MPNDVAMQNHPEKSNTPRFHDVISVYKSSRNTQYDKLFPMTLVPTCKRLGGGHARPAPKLGAGCSHGRLGSRVPDEVFVVVVGGKDFRSAQTAFGLLFGMNTMTCGDGDGGEPHVERRKRGIGMMLQLQ